MRRYSLALNLNLPAFSAGTNRIAADWFFRFLDI